MKIQHDWLAKWASKGHQFGDCMSHPKSNFMYVNIPKNASSWVKLVLENYEWEYYNYHSDHLSKHAMVVLRDPIDRWLSGIAEYHALYHPNIDTASMGAAYFDLIFEQVTFDDHTDHQVYFLSGMDTYDCTFFLCDDTFRSKFSEYVIDHIGVAPVESIEYQHVTDHSPPRKQFKDIFSQVLNNNPRYQQQLKSYFEQDYDLINSVKFYGSR